MRPSPHGRIGRGGDGRARHEQSTTRSSWPGSGKYGNATGAAGNAKRCSTGEGRLRCGLPAPKFPDVSEHVVDRVMRDEGRTGLVRGRKTVTTIPVKNRTRADDMLNRLFTAPRLNHA